MTHHCPQIWRSKKNSNSTQFIELYFGVSEKIKHLQPIGQAAQFKFEPKFEPLPTSASRLAITLEDYSRRQSKDLTAKSTTTLAILTQFDTTLAILTQFDTALAILTQVDTDSVQY